MGSLFPDTEIGQRNRDIVLDHFNGTTHADIAAKHGLDRSTVTKLVGDKQMASLGQRLNEELQRRGIDRRDFLDMMRTAAGADDEAEAAQHEEGAEDSTPQMAEELTGNDRVQKSMGTIKSVGGSQGAVEDTDSLGARWEKAYRDGDTAAMKAIEAEAQKTKVNARDMGFSSTEDRARDRWDALAEQHGAGYDFDSLPEKARDDFTDFVRNGQGNLADMSRVLEDVDAGKYDENEEEGYASRSQSLKDLEDRYHGVADMHDYLKSRGLDHAEAAVDGWSVIPDSEKRHPDDQAYYDPVNNTVQLTEGLLKQGDQSYVKQTMDHEMAHGLDMIGQGGVYSVQPELRFEMQDGEWAPVGEVAQELHDLWSDGNMSILDYPLDRGANGDLASKAMHAELFAQLWSIHNFGDAGRQFLERVAPKTAQFMQEVENDIKQQSAATLSARTGNGAAAEAERFTNRNAPAPQDRGLPEAASPWGGERPGLDKYRSQSDPLYERAAEANARRAARVAANEPQPAEERAPLAERTISSLPENIQPAAQKIWDNVEHWSKVGAQAFTFGHDLADWAQKTLGMSSPKDYMNLISEKAAFKADLDHKLSAVGEQAAALKPNERRMAGQYLNESTARNLWGYQPDWRKGSTVTIDPAMRAKFEALPANVKDVVKAVNQHGDVMRQNMISAYQEFAKMVGEEDAPKLPKFNMDGPWSSLQRVGNFVVEAQSKAYKDASPEQRAKMQSDEKHYVYEQVKSQGEANARRRVLEQSFGRGNVKAQARDEYYRGQSGSTVEQLGRLREKIAQQVGGGKGGNDFADAMLKMVDEMHANAQAERTTRAMNINRKNIAGARPEDALEAFFTAGKRNNAVVSNMLKARDVNKAMRAMSDEADSQTDPDLAKRQQDMVNEYMARQTAQMRTPEPSRIMDNLMNLNTAWRLMSSPAHYLQYIAQPFAMAMPNLAARFGYGTAGSKLVEAYQDAISRVSGKGYFSPNVEGHVSKVGDENAMFAEMKRQGLLDAAHGGDYGNPRLFEGPVTSALTKVSGKTAMIARTLEGWNRIGTSLAAYRAHYEDAMSRDNQPSEADAHLAATKFAAQTLRTAYGDWSAANSPRALMSGATRFGDATRLMTQYKKFALIHTALVARGVHEAFAGDTPAERAVAQKSLGFMAAHYGVLGGALGIPFAGVLSSAINAVFGDKGDTDETTLRKMIGDDGLADVLLHGAPALVGINATEKLGVGGLAGQLVPIRDNLADTLKAAAGPLVGGVGTQVYNGIGKMISGDYYGGLAAMAPKGIIDGVQGLASFGEPEQNTKGDVLSKDDKGFFASLGQTLGIPTLAHTKAVEQNESIYNAKQDYDKEFTSLKQQFMQVRQDGGSTADLNQQWMDLSKEMRDRGFTPPPLSQMYAQIGAQQRRQALAQNGVESNSKDYLAVRKMQQEEGQ
ncbi:PLxRFG domain-containing protein [Paraburkholderia unamae]|uniref:PLxRFG domain-containing protein n=1 Tax=Paraburkholderia unamae TaxID=219649 RepID=A0ACC6RH07_9BURK